MPQFYFYSAVTNLFKKLYLPILLILVSTVNLNAQNCTVNAGVLNVTICETDALVLTGNTPSPITGTVHWTQISGPAVVINSPTSPSTTISGYTGGNTYTFRYSATCTDGILSYQDKVVNVKPITIANAGGNIASCPNNNGTLAIIGNTPQNTGENGYWEIVGANNAGVVINFPNSATSTITLPDTSCGVTTLQWVIEGPEFAPGQRCRTTSQITVTNYGGVKPVNAGPDQTLSNCYTTTQSTNLNATYGGCGLNGQNGTWTFVSGPNTPTIASPNSNNTGISNLVQGTYTFRWTVTGACASGNDLVVINVPAATQDVTQLPGGDENIFFCDNTINQVTLVAQTPLYAGETVLWTQVSGGAGAVIHSPTNPTTLVTGISSTGAPYRFRYTLTNNNTGCVFTKDYIVQYNGATRTIVANNGDDIVGSCNATVFTIPLTVTGTGSNQYRIVSGPALSPLGPFPTALQDVGNSLTLTLTAPGDYTVEFIRRQTGSLAVECDYGFDTLNILVSGEPTPSNAGTDVSLPCGDTSTMLSGVSTADGLHFWSQLSGPNTAVIADNFAVDTQVSGLISGTYVFQYITKGGGATCGFSVSTVTVYVSDSAITNVNAGPDQLICTNSQVPLSANQPDPGEIGTWSQVSGPDTVVFSNVNDPNAIATGFLTTNSSYQLRWTVTYTHPGPSCGGAVSDNVTIDTSNLLAPTQSDAGPDACYSSGTTTFNLSGNTPGITDVGTWTVVPSAGVVIADENDPNTMVTVPGNGTYVFTWSIIARIRTCIPSQSSVSVTVAETPPVADAGPDQEICGNTITMAATQSGGSVGTWTRISGVGNYTVSDIHDPHAVFTFNYSGYYIFRWTVDASVCGQAFDDINLTIGIPPHQAVAGPDQNICNNNTVTMAGSTYDSFFELGQWSVLTGAPNQPTIVDPSNPNTLITGLVAGTYTFRWTITAKSIFLCQGTFDDMVVVVNPAADAGPDQTNCDVTSVQLKAGENSKGTWTLKSTSGNVNDVVITQSPADSYIANATVVPGNTYVFTFTTPATSSGGNTCPGTSDDVNVTIYSGASIDPNAGPDQTLCISDVGGTTTMSGNTPPPDVTTAEWRFVYQPAGSVAVITTPSAPLTTVTNLTVPGLYILEWVFESNNCRTLSDIVRIQMNAPPSTANAGPDDTVACQTTYKTAAVPPTVGIGTWTFVSQPPGGSAVIDNPNSPVTTLSNINVLGSYTLQWTVTNGPFTNPSLCQPSSDTVTITFNADPPSIANAGPDQELCNVTSTTMDAVPVTSGVGTWTQVSGPNTANIASPNTRNSLMFNLIPGVYEFRWTTTTPGNNGCTSQDTVLVTIYQNPSTADAGPNKIVPQFTPINLNAVAPTVGTGSWTQVSGPSTIGFTDPSSPTTAVTGTIPGIYTLQWNVNNGNCAPSTDTMNLTILSVADLELTKTVTPTTGSVGDVVTFNINVFNNNNSQGGTVTATNVAVRDYIPQGFVIVPGSVNSAGQYNVGDNTVTWTGLTIPSGSILNLTFKATIRAGGSYVNSAEVIASDQFDPDSAPNNGIASEDDQDSATVILDAADLSLQKTVSPTSVSINDNVIFTIRVTNSGPNNATGVTVSDHLPPGYTYVSDNGGGKYNNTTGIWNIGNLNNGNSLALQITAKVNVATTANYVNTAEVQTSHQFDPDSTPGNGLAEDDKASANITLKTADLELTKTVSPTTGASGDEVNFTLAVLNKGPGNSTGVSVQDVIPPGFSLIPGSVSNGGFYNIANANLTWQNLTITNGATLNLTFKAIVTPLGGYLNIAQVTASDLRDPDSTPNNDDGDQSEDDESNAPFTFIGPTADLSLTKSVVAGNTSPVVGSQVSFELVIKNDGPNNATGVQVTDLLPSGYQFVNFSSSAGLYNETTGVWNVGTVDVGVAESLILDAKVLPTGNYLNTAQVTASDLPDPDSAPNNDDGDQSEDDEDNAVTTPISPLADLSLTKTVDNATPLVGSLVTFKIITTNSGPQNTAHVTVTDLLPSGYTFRSFNATSGTYDSATGIWSLDILQSSESETLQIIAEVNPTGDYTNVAEVSSSDIPDPDSTPNNGIATEDDYATATTVPVQQAADLSLVKTVNNTNPIMGTQVKFEIAIANEGPQNTTGVTVTDLLPSGYTFNSYTSTTGVYNELTGLWYVGSMGLNQVESLQITATVNNTGNYTNSAEITSSDVFDPDSTPGNGNVSEDDYSEATTVPVPPNLTADLAITKLVDNATPVVGSQVTFTIAIHNDGPIETQNVVVTDLLPSGYTYSSYSATDGLYDPVLGKWYINRMEANDLFTIQIRATVNASGNYTNIAEVTASDQPDSDSTPNNGVTTEDDYATVSTVPVAQSADLSVTKTVNNATPLVGSQVIFSVQISNAGPQDTSGVTVTDLLPTGYTYASYSSTAGSYDSATGLWTIGNLSNGASQTLQITATVNPTGDYLNFAEVTASSVADPDSTPNNGSTTEDDYASATVTPVPLQSDLSLTKTVSDSNPIVNTEITFELIVTNSGPQDNTGVQVTDLLPAGFAFTRYTVSTGTYNATTGLWNIGNLRNGQSESLQISAIANAIGNFINRAEVTAADLPDPDSTPNNGAILEDDFATALVGTRAETPPPPPVSDLSLTKTVNNATPLVGSQVTFEVVISNGGKDDNKNVQVTDLLPSGYTFSGYTLSTGTYVPATGIWTVGDIANGKSETLQITAIVNGTGNYVNVAEVTAADFDDPDSTPNNGVTTEDDYATATVTPTAQSSDLSITKIFKNTTQVIGDPVTFEIVITNNGPQNNTGVQVKDLLPSGYTFTSYTNSRGTYDQATGLWNIGNLPAGQSETLQVLAIINDGGDYTNIAEVTAADLPDPDSTPNNGVTTEDDYAKDAVVAVRLLFDSDLSLTKKVNNTTPLVGSIVTFEVVLTNNGSLDNTGVQVTDLLPSGYTFNAYTVSDGTYNPTTGIWNIGSIVNGKSETLQILATVNPTGNYTNSAEVTAADENDFDSTPNNGPNSEDDYAEATTTPISLASDLSLTKTVNNATPLVGAHVTFQVVVTNNGPQDNTGVQVTDLLPTGYTFNGFTSTTGTYDTTTGLWVIGNLANGKTETLQITATVNPTGNYLNIAEVTAAGLPDPDSTPNNAVATEDDYATATTTPTSLASDLSLTKTVNNATPLVGAQVTFEVVATNNGPQDNTGVQVTDLLPTGYTYNGFTVSTGTYNPTTGLWNIGNLINGKSETLQITGTVNPTGNYLNIAEATAAGLPDPDSTPNNAVATEDDYATATVTPTSLSSDLSLTKTVSNATPLVGAQVTFQVVVTNNGPQDNTGVQVTDLLPTGYTYNGFTATTGTYNPTTGLWMIGNLTNGQSETLQIAATVNLTGNYVNAAEITAAGLPDPDSAPNNGVTTEDDYATATTVPITQAANLSLTKTVDNATPLIGSTVTFEVVITNSGPQNTAGVIVTDLLPTGYTFGSFSATKGTYNRTTGRWNIGSLLNGDSQTLQITATVNATGNYTNIAEVTASNLPDPNSTPNNGITTEDDYATATTVPTIPMADLSLTKSVIGGNLSPIFGATVTFEIIVTNSGPQTATGVSVKDLLPSGFEYVVYSSTKGQYHNTTGIWDIGTIPNGVSESLLIGAKVNITGNYNNIAEVFSSNIADPDSTPNNNVAGEDDMNSVLITPVPAETDLSLEKNVVGNNLTPAVGSAIAFSITVTNDGPSVSTGVTIKDVLPSGYQYAFFNSTSGSYDPATGIWTPGPILPGNSHTLLINAFVKAPTGTANEFLNTAEIMTSDQHDPDSTPGNGVVTEDDYDSISVTPVIVMADLSLTKTALNANATYDVGSTVIFTVTVKNDGPANASGVSVKDLLPPGFKYLTSAPTSGLYNYITGVWNVGIVTAGNDESLDIYTTVNPPSGAANEYTNTTEIIASNLPDPDSTPNNGVVTEDDYASLHINVAVADLSLDKTVSNKNANVNEVITFTLQLDNAGPSVATGVNVDDIIPLGYRNITNISNGGIFSNNTIKWANLTVPVGGVTLTYQVTVANPKGLEHTDYVNMAQVTASNQFDPDSKPNNDNGDQSEDDEDSEFINIPSTDIAINKEVDQTDVAMYSSVVFTITAENLGNLAATNVEIKDLLPKGYQLENATATAGSYDGSTGIWKIPNVAPKGIQTLTLKVKVVDVNDYLNIAFLSSMDQIDTNPSNNQDSATVKPSCLKIWNEFSPNDDGQNDTFYIDCITQYPNNELSIFNRWGNIVYFKKGYDNTWDGKEKGSAKTLPEGTYFYILDLGDGSEKTSGWVYLKN
ncbi:PKD domain-containing protein [Flavobacterium daemonense]|uniref:PKD domain-containing protein n=1 Tax=Flavobacterium daemonense TaxID=1393049 RepID=UPI001184B99B|nr:gliding motility-associated C-terminal domain-containing protein [Flavobacterium daemonense]KAF2336918.1 DUF11 domain-containing protein [Flavobacterium daemonense]